MTMIMAIIILTLAFAWLAYETDYFRVRLPVGKDKLPKYARYAVYNTMGKQRRFYYGDAIHTGNNYPPDYSPNGEPEYTVILSPGVDNVLCGYEWLDQHCADLVDYEPRVYMTAGNVRYDMVIKDFKVIKDIMRVNKITKKRMKAIMATA